MIINLKKAQEEYEAKLNAMTPEERRMFEHDRQVALQNRKFKTPVEHFLYIHHLTPNAKLNFSLLIDYLNIELYYTDLPRKVIANAVKEDNKLCIELSNSIIDDDKTSKLAIAYILGFDYYEEQALKNYKKHIKENPEKEIANLYGKEFAETLTQDEMLHILNIECDSKSYYDISLKKDFMQEQPNESFAPKQCRWFAKELVNKDYYADYEM